MTIDPSAVGGFTPGTITAQTLAGGTKTITTAAGTSTVAGVVSGAGALTKNGAGTLTLSGNNTYTGATAINAGTLQLGAANRIANTSAVTVAGGATFNLNNFAETIGSLAGAGTVTLGTGTLSTGGNNGTTTYSGVLSGTGGLTKQGTGTFTLSGANAYTGATTISAGTLQLSGGSAIANTSTVTLANVAGATLDLNGTSETIGALAGGGAAGGNVTLGAGTLTTGVATNTTYSGVISGTGGLTKQGTGAFTLSGANTYTGATTINAGTLTLGAANRIADASAVVLNAGTFNLNNFSETVGSIAGTGAVSLGTGTLTTGGDNTSTAYSGVMSGTGGLTKTGTGTFTLSGNNTYTGATSINAGTLTLGAADRIANTSAVTVAGGATFNLNSFAETIGSLAGAGNVMLGTGTLTTGGNNTSTTYSGVMSGTGGLTKQGTGIFTLSGANAYTGSTTINAGTLRVAGGAAITDTAAVTLANVAGATLDLNGASETIGSLAGGGATGGNVTLGAGALTTGGSNTSTTYSGIISGTGGLTKAGTGILTLSGNNTYTGATTINAGTLQLGAANRIANTSAVTVAGGAMFNLNNFAETIGSLAGAGTVTLGTGTLATGGNNGTTTYSGVLSGTGGLTKQGTGTFTLSGGNTYTGTTTISAGTLRVSGGASIVDTSAVTLANVAGAVLDLNGTNETIGSLAGGGGTGGNVTLGAGTLTTGGNNTSTTYSGILSGAGGQLVKQGTGTLTLAGNNTYSSATSINAGTISINADARLGTAPGGATAGHLNLNGGTLQTTGNFTLNANRGVALGGTGGMINTNAGTTLTYNGVIAGPAAGPFIKAGTGTLIVGGSSTYAGATNINAGTLTLGAANRLPDASAVTVAGGATFNLNTFAETIGSLAGTGNVTLGTATLTAGGDNTSTTYSGIMSGTGGLTKTGTGTLTFSGANTYTGATNVNAGVLVASANNALGTAAGGTTVASGATLGFSGGINYATAEPVTLNGGTLANVAGNNTFAGPLTLTANSAITVADGTTMTVGGTINGGSQLNVTSGTGGINFFGAIGGITPLSSLAATVGSISLGPVTTLGTQTYTGTTTLNGNLTTTNSALTFNSPVTLGANSVINAGTGAVTLGNTVDGAFGLAANSTGTTIFMGAVGGITPLASLTSNPGGTTAINGGSVTTSGNQTYNDNVTMNQATSFTSTGGTISLGGNATNNAAGTGITIDAPTINLTGGTTIATTGNGPINFFTDTLNPNGAGINAGTAAFTLSPNTPTNTIEFGDVNTGRITDVYYGSNFGTVTAGSFTIGRPTHTGNIFVSGVAAAPAALNMVTGGMGTITFETAPYVSGNQNLGVASGSGGISLGNDVTLGTGTLRLTTSGAITQTAGVITANTAGLSAGNSITLSQLANNVTTLAAQTSTGDISLTDANGLTIAGVGATGDGFHPAITGLTAVSGTMTLQSGGAVTQTQRILASTLNLQGNGPYTLTNASNDVSTLATTTPASVQYTDANALIFGASSVSGNFDVATSGAITQSGAVTVAGTTTLAAGAANDITLTNAGNNFATIGITSGRNVALADANALDFSASTVSGTLSVTTNGALTQSGALNVAATTTLAAGAANDIALTNLGNDFGAVGITSGNNVALTDTNSLDLAASTVSGTLNVTTNGALTQSGGLNVIGITTLSPGPGNNIIFANPANDFSSVSITSGNNATLQDSNAIGLGAMTVSGTLNVTATGAITDANGSTNNITAATANLTGAIVGTAGDPIETSVGTLNATSIAGGIFVTQANAVTLGNVVAGAGDVTITNTAGDMTINTVTAATGAVNLTAAGGSILDGNGTANNVTASADSTLNALGGVIGVSADPIDVNITGATLGVAAINQMGGISATLNGTVSPGNSLIVLNSPPGLVLFNGIILNPPPTPLNLVNLGLLTGTAVYLNPDAVVSAYYLKPSRAALLTNVTSTYLPGTIVLPSYVSVTGNQLSVTRTVPPCTLQSGCLTGEK